MLGRRGSCTGTRRGRSIATVRVGKLAVGQQVVRHFDHPRSWTVIVHMSASAPPLKNKKMHWYKF